ncbi:MAG: hypothetical protein MZW92_03405 [Comamonadaceae bacterium]|nr:hypothetical protein [Comamonadaceae bacterium]
MGATAKLTRRREPRRQRAEPHRRPLRGCASRAWPPSAGDKILLRHLSARRDGAIPVPPRRPPVSRSISPTRSASSTTSSSPCPKA